MLVAWSKLLDAANVLNDKRDRIKILVNNVIRFIFNSIKFYFKAVITSQMERITTQIQVYVYN